MLVWQPEHAGALALEPQLRQAVAAAELSAGASRDAAREIRALLDAGDLAAAETRLAQAGPTGSASPTLAALQSAVASRRARADVVAQQAAAALARRDASAARELVAQALALDRAHVAAAGLAREAAEMAAQGLAEAVGADLRRGDIPTACARLSRGETEWPDLGRAKAAQGIRQRVLASLQAEFERDLGAGRLREVISAYEGLDPRWQAALSSPLAEGLPALRSALAAAAAGDIVTAAQQYALAAEHLDAKAVGKAGQQVVKASREIGVAVDEARVLASGGDLIGARARLEQALAQWPLVRTLQDEMRRMDDGVLERQTRLTAARRLASEGRLREASALALALASPGSAGEEARRLHAELQARIDVVAAGVEQILRAVHGRSSGSIEGIGHSVARLDELAKLQSDHPELPGLRVALEAERKGLELVRDAVTTCRGGRLSADLVAVGEELRDLRPTLLREDRLDARLLELADAAALRGESACARGDLGDAECCGALLAHLRTVLPAVGVHADDLAGRIAAGRARARDEVERGRRALADRELASAESAFETASQAARDDAIVRAFGQELDTVRARMHQLAEVEGMAAKRDFARAHERLASLPPTPALLRTKIFDLKQNLARAQGLDGGFVLRVDEAGEYLVMRRETVSIGNLRDGRADLAVLANISGQHARLQRRMSFHGGMEDHILAERGEVSVGGVPVRDHRLRDGDEVALGGRLRFAYRVPSSRSLTTALRVLGGFHVRGTDRILLMKDRGRDGRILLGRARDAHVSVASESGAEVELYAGLDGQIRVRCDRGGTIDGRPFVGEHPVMAGAAVACGGISFVLLPLGAP
ncbi:MAG: FHA domain-containing protein [Planctomycetota bacterium]